MTDRLHRTDKKHRRRGLAWAVSTALLAGAAVVAAPTPALAACSGPGAPANDNYNSARVFGNNTFLASGSNCYATAETGEPAHAGQAASSSVWFSLQPTHQTAGRIYISTSGSDFDTRLGVYDSGHILVSSLNLIASNDDASSSNNKSYVEIFNPVGRSLNVAVDGYRAGSLTHVGSVIVGWAYMLTPFTSVADMVGDLTEIYSGRTPTNAEIATAQSDFASGRGRSPAMLANRLLGNDAGMERARAVARLYTAVLGRLPDTGGLEYWIAQRKAGVSLQEVARRITGSPEFVSTYGSLNNTQFVNLVYANVLGRSPDAAGRNYWVGRLNNGFARAAMMIGFSESPEFKTSSAKVMNASVIFRLGHANITSAQIRALAYSEVTITDLWGHVAENAGYRSYVATL